MPKIIVIIGVANTVGSEFRALWCPNPEPENLVTITVQYHNCVCIEKTSVDPSTGETIASLVVNLFSEGIDQTIRHQLHPHNRVTFPSEGDVRDLLLSNLAIRRICAGLHPNCWQSALIDAARLAFSTGIKLADDKGISRLGSDLTDKCARFHSLGLCR